MVAQNVLVYNLNHTVYRNFRKIPSVFYPLYFLVPKTDPNVVVWQGIKEQACILFGPMRKMIPSWRKISGISREIRLFQTPIVPGAIYICSQAQKITDFWGWDAYLLSIEKISGKMSLFSPDSTVFWVWTRLNFCICPTRGAGGDDTLIFVYAQITQVIREFLHSYP